MSADSVQLDALIAQFHELRAQFEGAMAEAQSEQGVRRVQAQYLGKKGDAAQIMAQMGKLPKDQRRGLGAAFNEFKTAVEETTERRLSAIAQEVLAAELEKSIDVTAPGRVPVVGATHLLTQVTDECVRIFAELGFAVAEGPQIDSDFHCFEALAIPKDHPARDMQDTYYITEDVVLRPHTSPVQIRTMKSHEPPIAIVSPGIVYRRDDDPTHSPMFSQIEGLWVDEDVRFSDLKGVLLHFVRSFFGESLTIRFRPSYFPFVEPGAEVDMQCSFCGGAGCRVCKQTGWIEIGGCGMVDPEVFGHVGIDPQKYQGFAFGMGLERMAMLRHGVNDIKHYYTGDVRFLRQFQ